MGTPRSTDRAPGRSASAFAGRFLGVLCATVFGTVVGLAAGVLRATAQMNAVPVPGRATMGMESSGLATILVWAVNLLLGGGAGLLMGLLVGMVGMVAYGRTRGRG